MNNTIKVSVLSLLLISGILIEYLVIPDFKTRSYEKWENKEREIREKGYQDEFKKMREENSQSLEHLKDLTGSEQKSENSIKSSIVIESIQTDINWKITEYDNYTEYESPEFYNINNFQISPS